MDEDFGLKMSSRWSSISPGRTRMSPSRYLPIPFVCLLSSNAAPDQRRSSNIQQPFCDIAPTGSISIQFLVLLHNDKYDTSQN